MIILIILKLNLLVKIPKIKLLSKKFYLNPVSKIKAIKNIF